MAKKSMSYDDVLAKCAALCAKAEHSRVEMIGRMCRWGVSRELAQMVADRLEDGGFIDARRFAEAFVHDKSKFDFWGRIKIRYYLRMKLDLALFVFLFVFYLRFFILFIISGYKHNILGRNSSIDTFGLI